MNNFVFKRLSSLSMALFLAGSGMTGCSESDAVDDVDLEHDVAALSNGDTGDRVDREDRQASNDRRRGKVRPLLDCVELLPEGRVLAHWGYTNSNRRSIRRKIGMNNRFAPGQQDRGQPTLFRPGTAHDVFLTSFKASNTVTWRVDGTPRSASVGAPRCPGSPSGSAGTGAAGSVSPTGGTGAIGGTNPTGGTGGVVTGGSGGSAPVGGTGGVVTGGTGGVGGTTPVGGTGGVGGTTGGTSGGGGGGDACNTCESQLHNDSPNCTDSTSACDILAGTNPSGQAYSLLCRKALSCFHANHCARTAATDCLCGPGRDPNDCFTGTLAAATGPCKDDAIAAALTSATAPSVMTDLQSRFFDTSTPLGAAVAVVETCDQLFCAAQCL